jgi:hypothetical protein
VVFNYQSLINHQDAMIQPFASLSFAPQFGMGGFTPKARRQGVLQQTSIHTTKPEIPFSTDNRFRSYTEAEAFLKRLGVEHVDLRFPDAIISPQSLAENLACMNYLANGLARYANQGIKIYSRIELMDTVKDFTRTPYNHFKGSPAETVGDRLRINPGYDWTQIESRIQKNYNQGYFSSGHPEYMVDHEMGHFLHALANPTIHAQAIRTDVPPEHQQLIKKEVSRYTHWHYDEMVADVFAGLAGGKEFSEPVMTLANEHGLPSVDFKALRS